MIMDMLVAEGHGSDGAAAEEEEPRPEDGLTLSSLELVRLLVSLEERLGISLDDTAILNAQFNTVDDIVELVTQAA
jgi:acyl carrier protein